MVKRLLIPCDFKLVTPLTMSRQENIRYIAANVAFEMPHLVEKSAPPAAAAKVAEPPAITRRLPSPPLPISQLQISNLHESPLFTRLIVNSVRRETGTPGKYGKHKIKARSCSKIAGTSQRTLQTACNSTEPPALNIFEHSSPVLFENSNLQPFRALPPNARCCLSSKDRTTTEQSVACPDFGKPGVERK